MNYHIIIILVFLIALYSMTKPKKNALKEKRRKKHEKYIKKRPVKMTIYNSDATQHDTNKETIYLADAYASSGDFENALKYYSYAATNGHLKSFLTIGHILIDYYNDKRQALKWFEQAYKISQKLITKMPQIYDVYIDANFMVTTLRNEIGNSQFDDEITTTGAYKYNLMGIHHQLTDEDDLKEVMGGALHRQRQLDDVFNTMNIQNITRNTVEFEDEEIRNERQNATDILNDTPEVRNDSQNVHDHYVQNTLKKSIENVIENTDKTLIVSDRKVIYDQINKEIERLYKNDPIKFQNATNTIVRIMASENDHIERLDGMSLADVLEVIWKRINDPCNNDRRSGLINSLIEQLNNSVEHKNVVCSTGIATRIVQSLEKLDNKEDIVDIKPKWAIKNEMLLTCSAIRKEMDKEIDDNSEIKKALETKEEEQSERQKNLEKDFNEEFKQRVKSKLHRDYVEKGIMDETAFKIELNSWIDSIA